ncbi:MULTISPECIES: flavin reductase family protein [Streptomyces]|nr:MULTISPECIES: flavin reductase family protein [Streptomyces]
MPQPATPPQSPGGPIGLGWDALRDEPGPDTTRCLGLYARLAGGVAVVTALDAHGGPTGMTVSALTSLSARPPLLLACLRGGSRTLAALRWRGAFAVSLLAEHQRAVAERFADPALPPAARCTGVPLRQVLGLPVLDEAVGWTVCLVEDVRRYGDHHTVVGRLRAVGLGGGRPLVWHDRSFHTLDHDSVHTLDHD